MVTLLTLWLCCAPARASAQVVAYLTNQWTGTVSALDTGTNIVTTTIHGFAIPIGIAVRPGASEIYVTNRASGLVSVVEVATNSLAQRGTW